MDTLAKTIQANLAYIQAEINAACQRVGRNPADVTLVAVTKQRTLDEVLAVIQAGITHLGENRVEEAEHKIMAVDTHLRADTPRPLWHMIGHVQSRKAKEVMALFDWVHSLDSAKLAHRYAALNAETPSPTQFLLEVNLGGEAEKYGMPAHMWETSATQRQTLWELVGELSTISALKVVGLMTMAPYVAHEDILRTVFGGLKRLQIALANDFPQMTWQELSMGMTNDYAIAIEEGSTMVRIGRAIFESRG